MSNFRSVSGKGVSGKINGLEIHIGSVKYFKENEQQFDFSDYDKTISNYQQKGYTTIVVSRSAKVIGVIAVADKIKADSQSALDKIKQLGIKTVMITGDNQKSASAIAEQSGIEEVYAELLPQNKIEKIKELQGNGEIVAMVGDGVNDAPALKQADVGIAIGSGTDIAIESADITLVSNSLESVSKAIHLSRATFKKIKQNLFWAFFYNVIAVPIAFVGVLHPIIAEIAMALSSINVVGNSLRLKKTKL